MPKNLTIDPAQLDGLINEVVNELTDILKSEDKSVKVGAEEESLGPSGPSAPAVGAADAPAPEAPAADAAGAPGADAAPADAAGAAPDITETPLDDGAPDAAGAPEDIEADGDPVSLHAEYAKLTDDELKDHFEACKAAIMARLGNGGESAPKDDVAPPAPPADAAPAPEAPKADAPPAEAKGTEDKGEDKSEAPKAEDKKDDKKDVEKSESIVVDLAKAEQIAALEKKLADQNEAIAKLCEVVASPIRKSVKGLSDLQFIAKGEGAAKAPAKEYTREQAITILNDKIKDGSLSKSDRSLAMDYTFNRVGLDKIAHLLG